LYGVEGDLVKRLRGPEERKTLGTSCHRDEAKSLRPSAGLRTMGFISSIRESSQRLDESLARTKSKGTCSRPGYTPSPSPLPSVYWNHRLSGKNACKILRLIDLHAKYFKQRSYKLIVGRARRARSATFAGTRMNESELSGKGAYHTGAVDLGRRNRSVKIPRGEVLWNPTLQKTKSGAPGERRPLLHVSQCGANAHILGKNHS